MMKRNKRNRTKKRNRKKVQAVLVLVFAAVAGCAMFAVYARERRDPVEKVKLETPVCYNKELRECMEKLRENGMDAVIWTEHESDTVTNAEYNRSVNVKTLGVAGDASILFPGGNRLAFSATGYCILGEDTAWRLFGSTKAVGRSVTIQDQSYHVAGIEYQEKELCVYGLAPEQEEMVTDLGIRSQKREEMEMNKRKVGQILGEFSEAD